MPDPERAAEPPGNTNAGPYEVGPSQDGRNISIIRREGGPSPSADELAFLGRLSKALQKVNALTQDDARRPIYYDVLLAAARTALDSPRDLSTALFTLGEFERNFIETEGPILRNAYLKSTIALGAAVAVACLLVAVIIDLH